MSPLVIVPAVIWLALAAYYLAGAPKRLRIRREGREARERQEQQYAAPIAGVAPGEAADLLTPAGRQP